MFFRNLLLFVFFVATERHVNCSQLYALFHRHEGRYLPNRVIRRTLANTETDCAMYCLREEECVSVNYKPSGEERAGLCELNNETLSETFTNDLNKEEFNHLQIFQRKPKKKPEPPKSCKSILTKSPRAASGLYDIYIDNKMVTVYCEMVLHDGGFTFIPKSAMKKGTLPNLLPQLFTSRNEVLLYIQNKDGSQTYTYIEQLQEQENTPLAVLQNTHSVPTGSYNKPLNAAMLDYLYLSTSTNTNGFLSNNRKVKYNNRGPYPIRSYFAFFPNHRGQSVSKYHGSNLVYEREGVAVDWRRTGKVSTNTIPSNFFFLTEIHYGGDGCYTSSDRWTEANGTAIGLR